MQAQDTATAYFFKVWSWVETNVKQVLLGLGVVVVAIALVSYYFWRQNQLEIDAGQALTQVVVSAPTYSDASQLIEAYSKIAADYPGTQSGQRALILGATALFDGGKYPEAQAQFQKYLDTIPDGAFSASAALGVATSLEAQGKTDLAASRLSTGGEWLFRPERRGHCKIRIGENRRAERQTGRGGNFFSGRGPQ